MWCMCVVRCSVKLFATPWTVAHHALLSMEMFRQRIQVDHSLIKTKYYQVPAAGIAISSPEW